MYKEQYIIYGAGNRGQNMLTWLLEYADVVGFADSNPEKYKGGGVNGIRILDKEEVKNILSQNRDISFIISPLNENSRVQIAETIKAEFGNAKIKNFDELQNEYIMWKHKNAGEIYDVRFENGIENWADGITSEIEFNKKHAMEKEGRYHKELLNSLNNDLVLSARGECGDIIYDYLYDGAVLMDIGSSSVAKYGDILPNGMHIESYAIDALAFFYNRLYEKYALKVNNRIKFGLFEFMAAFYKKNSVDVILIENALDHSINPVKGILECLEILKEKGLLRLFHRKCEAVYEGYAGFHQWNIDYNDNLELIVWNNKNYINVNKLLGTDVEIRIIPMPAEKRIDQYFVVEIQKRSTYNYTKYVNVELENRQLAKVLRVVMKKWAETIDILT